MNSRLDNLVVVILNYNNASLSLAAADKLLNLNLGCRVVITDNCSTDNSPMLLKTREHVDDDLLIVFNNANTGYAAGNNFGVKAALKFWSNIEYICIMNPDVVVQKAETLVKLCEALAEDERIGAITAETVFKGEYNQPNECAWHFFTSWTMLFERSLVIGRFLKPSYYKELLPNAKGVAYVEVVQGCFFVISRHYFLQVGGFDEHTFLYYEEMILGQKLKKLGRTGAVLIGERIEHNHKEKEKCLQSKKSKIFDLKCFLDSRIYYLENYYDGSFIYKRLTNFFLRFEFLVKKNILNLLLK